MSLVIFYQLQRRIGAIGSTSTTPQYENIGEVLRLNVTIRENAGVFDLWGLIKNENKNWLRSIDAADFEMFLGLTKFDLRTVVADSLKNCTVDNPLLVRYSEYTFRNITQPNKNISESSSELKNSEMASYISLPYGPGCYFGKNVYITSILEDVKNVNNEDIYRLESSLPSKYAFSLEIPENSEDDYSRILPVLWI